MSEETKEMAAARAHFEAQFGDVMQMERKGLGYLFGDTQSAWHGFIVGAAYGVGVRAS